MGSRRPFRLRPRLHALSGSITGKDHASGTVEPLSPQCALTLWRISMERVEPLVRIMFRWAIDELRAKSTNIRDSQPLTITEHALVQAI
jgi:hypothetical protein